MPRLPSVANLGERPVIRPVGGLQGTVTYRTPDLGATAQALTQAGGQVARVGQSISELNERIENARAQARRSAQINEALGESALELGKLEIEHQRDQDFATSPKRFAEKAELLRQRLETRVDDEAGRAAFNQKFNDLSVAKQLNVITAATRQEGDYHVAKLDETLNGYANAAATAKNPAEIAMLRGLAETATTDLKAAGWITDVDAGKRIKAWDGQVAAAVSKYSYANFRRELIDGRDSLPRLNALQKSVAADETLTEDSRNVLLNSTASRIDILERKLQAARDEYMRGTERALNKYEAMTLRGYEASPEDTSLLLSMAKGTSLEPEARRLQALAIATKEFRLAPPMKQGAMLNSLAAQVRAHPNPQNTELLTRYETIAENQRKDINKSPVEFAYRQGLAEPVPVDLANPAADPAALQQQVSVARAMQGSYAAPLKPLLPEQVDAIRGHLAKAKTDDKLRWFGELNAAMGDDKAAYSATMAQLAPDSPVTAIAGEYAGKGRIQAARLMLDGEAILRPNRKEDGKPDAGKLWPMPPERDLRREFERFTGEAFAGRSGFRDASYQAALSIYAKLSADAGDAEGEIDKRRFEEAARLAIGNVEKWNGAETVLPYELTKGAFKNQLRRRLDHLQLNGRYAEGMDADKAYDLPVQLVGDGRYVLRSGNGIIIDKDSKPIVIDFNQEPTAVTGKIK